MSQAAQATGLTVIMIDHASLTDIYDTKDGPLTQAEVKGAVIALVSPGLPRGADPQANLYATLTAGDVADVSNEHVNLLQRQLFAAGADKDVTMIRFGDVSDSISRSRLRALIQALENPPHGRTASGVMLVGVTPPQIADAKKWDSLTPLVWLTCGPGAGSDASLQPTLTSDTTQTPGLLALRDIAPTILAAEDASIPDSMSGHAAHVYELGAASRESRDQMLTRMNDLTRVNQCALAPFGWTYGFFSSLTLFASIWTILSCRRKLAPLLQYCIRIVVAVPVSLMLAPLLAVSSPAIYLAEIAGLAAVLAFIPKIAWLLAIAVVAIVTDAFAGTPLVSRSMLSAYWLSGIRFYGIGNEYMGLLIGMALCMPLLFLTAYQQPVDDASHPIQRLSSVKLVGLLLWYALVLFVLAYPQFGAKAGGAVTAMAAFLSCFLAVWMRKSPSLWMFVLAVVAGFATVFAFSWLSHELGGRNTHIQAATSAVTHGRLGYIAQIAVRKARMAVKVALMPGTFAAILGMIPVLLIWRKSDLRKRVHQYLFGRDDYRRGLIAGLWGMLAAVLFNDSGAVAALLLFGAIALPLMHELLGELCVSSPSMSAMSGSELRSATSLNSEPTPS